MKKIATITLFFAFASLVSIAQPLRSVPLDLMLETAEEQEAYVDWYNAIEWSEKAYKAERNYDVASKVAGLQYKLRNYKRAENWMKRYLNRDEDNIYLEDRFFYGKVLKATGRYKEAAAQFNQYIELSSNTDQVDVAKMEIQGMRDFKKLPDNIETVVQFAGTEINSAFTEYGPQLYVNDILYFAAIPSKKIIETEGFNDEQYSRIYTALKDEEGKYGKPTALEDHVNRPGYHTGNPTFSPDGNRMYFTRAQLEGNELNESSVYVCFKNDTGWSPAVEVTGINGDYIVKQPAVGELFGNEVLFFVSDMDGGYGKFDIYYATLKSDAAYASPVNVGVVINTKQNEATPFYKNGTLYFSTDGKPGLGGFDIHTTTWDGTKWSEPVNIGLGYNTPYDDMYLSYDQSGESGFLVSNRPDDNKKSLKGNQTCCDDIYAFNIRQIVIDLVATILSPKGPLDGAKIMLIDQSGSVSPKTKDSDEQGGGNEFQFLLDQDKSYRAIATKQGFYPDTVDFNTAGILDDFTVKKKFNLKPKPIAPEVEIVKINEAIRLNNIYYDFDDWKILPASEQDLNRLFDLMNKYPDMVIELSSHTDAQGVSTYNQKLSQRRAESAKSYLVDKGVVQDRIKPVGYGESVILNQCVNGVRCTDDEHRFNRRTEFKIIAGPQTIEIEKQVISTQKKK